MFDPNARVAIVTGGNGGIGLGMARGLARAGAMVVVAARDTAKSSEAVRELRALQGVRDAGARGGEAFAVAVDVRDEA
jgi:2-deoxy-D-gluconate 3-dehydrogenase